jgi:hypothetical protein
VDTDSDLEDAARPYFAAAEGDADRALQLALSDAREALEAASARISFGYVRGRLPGGPASPIVEPTARVSVTAP